MTLYQVYDTMTGLANQERSEKMAAYMRHQFDFLGIPTPLRRQQEKATFKKQQNKRKRLIGTLSIIVGKAAIGNTNTLRLII